MSQRLYPNIKRLNTLFCVAIVSVTLMALVLRLAFGDAATVSAGGVQSGVQSGELADSDQSFHYKINNTIYYAKLDAKGDVLIENPDSNQCYMQVNITRDDTGKSVYYSGDLSPGTSINTARIQGNITEEGVYQCTATITVFDPQTKDQRAEKSVPVTIYVGEKPSK